MPSSDPNPPPLLDAGARDTGPGPDRESRFSGLVFTIAETCVATDEPSCLTGSAEDAEGPFR
jgi:hypothetical protein